MLFKLLRWKNLLFVGLIQFMVYLRLSWESQMHEFPLLISPTIITLIAITTILATASGYVINDIIDIDIDKINRPDRPLASGKISLRKARRLYWVLLGTGFAGSIVLWLWLEHLIYPIFFLFCAYLMFFYSKRWKGSYFIGNLVVAILCAASILVVLAPDWNNPWLGSEGIHSLTAIIVLAWFGFAATLYREMVKDIEDMDGDQKAGLGTVPIVSGKQFATRSSLFLGSVIIISLITYLTLNWATSSWSVKAILIAVIFSAGYLQFILSKARSKDELHFVSQAIKVFMLFGIIAILIS